MFLVLLVLTLGIALATSALVFFFFNRPIRQILDRIIGEEIAAGGHRFLLFAIFVGGVSSRVQIWELGQDVYPERARPGGSARVPALDGPAICLCIYPTIIPTLPGGAG